jgi:RNA-directed DNA polymerase
VSAVGDNDDRLWFNGNNWNDNNRSHAFEIALLLRHLYNMPKTYTNLYDEIISLNNLVLAWGKARKHKTKKPYVIEFEANLNKNLINLHGELKNQTYKPKPLVSFILRDPKTRKISKSDFRDRIVHHALVEVIEPIFEKGFIYDSCANRIGKGNLFALKRFKQFMEKVSKNGKLNGWFTNNPLKGYCFKADIKHYFQEVDHEILLKILLKKIQENKVMVNKTNFGKWNFY